jgi:hypothetical protein
MRTAQPKIPGSRLSCAQQGWFFLLGWQITVLPDLSERDSILDDLLYFN